MVQAANVDWIIRCIRVFRHTWLLWPVSDRATPPIECLREDGRPAVGGCRACFAGCRTTTRRQGLPPDDAHRAARVPLRYLPRWEKRTRDAWEPPGRVRLGFPLTSDFKRNTDPRSAGSWPDVRTSLGQLRETGRPLVGCPCQCAWPTQPNLAKPWGAWRCGQPSSVVGERVVDGLAQFAPILRGCFGRCTAFQPLDE